MKKKKVYIRFYKMKWNKIKQNTSLKTVFYIVTVLVLMFFIVYQNLTIIQLKYQMKQNNELLLEYENDNKVLTEKIEKITTDQYIEEVAREKLGMVKSKEIPIKIVEVEDWLLEEKTMQPKEKIGVYMKDWYIKLKDWIGYLTKK